MAVNNNFIKRENTAKNFRLDSIKQQKHKLCKIGYNLSSKKNNQNFKFLKKEFYFYSNL